MTWSIRVATQAEDDILVRHYLAIWQSYGVGDINIRTDAEDLTRDFIAAGRANAGMAAFLAESDGKVVGSIACQVETLPYPDVTVPSFRRYGYIWSVYVEPAARRMGIAGALVQAALGHLRAIGCTKAVLHASDAGEQAYRNAGFSLAKEMRLDL
jgi:ribosomal protein S18 acetylase RimI-like enzyme